MTHPLDGPLAKLQRAEEHIVALDREIATWLLGRPHPIGLTFLGHSEEFQNKFRFEFREPPPHAGLVFGDVVTNLRASLDHITWQLALSQCGPDAVPSRRTAFPIQREPDRFRSVALDALKHVPVAAWDLIECLQPYHGWDWPELGWLRAINDLANDDKHRTNHLVAGRVTVTDSRTGSTAKIPHTLRDGDLLSLKIEPADHDRTHLVAAEVGVLFEDQVIGVAGLRELAQFVRDGVLPLFSGFFTERPDDAPIVAPTKRQNRNKTRTRKKRR